MWITSGDVSAGHDPRALQSFDRFRRGADALAQYRGVDALTQKAFDVLTSSRLVEALDISREPQHVRDRYGEGDSRNFGDGAPRNLQHFLVARRVVEAGCRVVTLNFGHWDFHSDNFNGMKNTHLPQFDQGLSALISDLHERGLDKDVAVVAWGEFGRTPKVNPAGGRDHWPQCFTVGFAGGGVRGGQVVGASDPIGGVPADRPVQPGDVIATIFHSLGLKLDAHLPGPAGRPFPLVDFGYREIHELFV